MIKGFLLSFSICVVILVLFLIIFRKKLRETRERENSIYQRLFKRKNKKL